MTEVTRFIWVTGFLSGCKHSDCGWIYLESEDLCRQPESSTPHFDWGMAALFFFTARSLTHYPTRLIQKTVTVIKMETEMFLSRLCSGVVTATCLEETSYLLWMTLQWTPATWTEFWMSSALWPRLEPEMVTTVPPSTGPDTGSNWNTREHTFEMYILPFFWHNASIPWQHKMKVVSRTHVMTVSSWFSTLYKTGCMVWCTTA